MMIVLGVGTKVFNDSKIFFFFVFYVLYYIYINSYLFDIGPFKIIIRFD